MKRRKFIKKGLIATTGIVAVTAISNCERKKIETVVPAIQTKKSYQWKMVTAWPKNFPALGTGANYLADMITKMSDGQLTIKVYSAGELVPAFEAFDAVSKGTAQMAHAAAYYWKAKSEVAQFFGAVPFGLTANEMSGWLNYGGGQQLWDETYAQFNLKPFAAGNTGVQMGGWFNKEINRSEDFKGLKMRIPGLGGEVLKKMGGVPVNLPGGEIFQALKTGVIDATKWNGPYNDLAFGLYKAAQFYYWPGWQEPGTVVEAFVNKQEYEALPEHLKRVIKNATEAAYNNMLSEFTARNSTSLQQLIFQHNVQLKQFPDHVLQQIGKTAFNVVEAVGNKAENKKVYDSFKKFRKHAIKWNQIGELGYAQARFKAFS